MNMGAIFALKALAVTIVLLPPFTQRHARDDRIPWGSEGTIGRGTGTRPRDFGNWMGVGPGPSTFTYSRGYSWVPQTYAAPSRPYLTNRYHEPGDGYRYPLYYDPVGRRYIYYPVRR